MLKFSSGLELINMLFIFMYQYIPVYVFNEGLYGGKISSFII